MTDLFRLPFFLRSIHRLSNVYSKAHVTRGRRCVIARGVRIAANLTLEDSVWIGKGCKIEGGPVFIGRGTNLLAGNWVAGPAKIGRYCAIAPNSSLLARNHPTNQAGMQLRFYRDVVGIPLKGVSKGTIELGNDVWVGTRAVVLSGIKIGDGAVIGAGSVVTKDVASYSITAGNPAKHINYRFPEQTVAQLLALKWWDWPADRVRRNRQFFTTDLNTVADVRSLVVD